MKKFPQPADLKSRIILFFALGFGTGKMPVAPGTFGTIPGLLWFWLLAAIGNYPVYIAACLAGVGASVWLAGAGEKILGETDPGSIVIDEIIAVPICFFAWFTQRHFSAAPPGPVFTGRFFLLSLLVFGAFRFFDVLKPWPIRQSQRLPGGWGVTVDDVLAAVYVNLVWLAASALWRIT